MSFLERCDGPVCPRCGCQDARILDPPAPRGPRLWWGGQGRARCRHCGFGFYFRETAEAPPTAPTPSKREEDIAMPAVPEAAAIADPPFDPDRGVVYHVLRCPLCGSDQVRITHTARPVRRHKCRACGHAFKSVERAE